MKNNFKIIIVSFLLFTSSFLLAKTKPAQTSIKPEKLMAKVHYGDLITNFDLNGGAHPKIKMNNSRGLQKEHGLSSNNFKVLVTQFNQLRMAKKNPAECYRSRMEVQYIDAKGKTITKESCFGVKVGFANDYHRFANLLVDVL